MNKKYKNIFFAIIIFLVVVGQTIKHIITNNLLSSKTIIKGILKISFVKNTGGAFGLGRDYLWIFIILNLVIIIAIIIYTQRKKEFNKMEFIGSIFILSGGIGNLIDRIFRGYVVDYIDINELINYPVFNLEDMLIVVGIVLIIIQFIKIECKGRS